MITLLNRVGLNIHQPPFDVRTTKFFLFHIGRLCCLNLVFTALAFSATAAVLKLNTRPKTRSGRDTAK